MWISLGQLLTSEINPCGGLHLTEVHPDPAQVPDHIGEFVEIYNPTKRLQSTQGWSLVLKRAQVPLPLLDLEPGDVLILSRGQWPISTPHYVWNRLRLPNRDGEVHLVDRCDVVRQKVKWGRRSGQRIRPGRSLELAWYRGDFRWRLSRSKDATYGDWASPGRVSKSLSRRLVPKETQSHPAVSTPSGSTRKERLTGD